MKDKSDGSQDNGDSGNIKSNYAMLDNDVKCASTTAKSGSKVISMCIVPVKIKHGDNNNGNHLCYLGQLSSELFHSW